MSTTTATIYEITEVVHHGDFFNYRTGRFAHRWELLDFLGECPYPIRNMGQAMSAYYAARNSAVDSEADEFEFGHGWATYTVRPTEGWHKR